MLSIYILSKLKQKTKKNLHWDGGKFRLQFATNFAKKFRNKNFSQVQNHLYKTLRFQRTLLHLNTLSYIDNKGDSKICDFKKGSASGTTMKRFTKII